MLALKGGTKGRVYFLTPQPLQLQITLRKPAYPVPLRVLPMCIKFTKAYAIMNWSVTSFQFLNDVGDKKYKDTASPLWAHFMCLLQKWLINCDSNAAAKSATRPTFTWKVQIGKSQDLSSQTVRSYPGESLDTALRPATNACLPPHIFHNQNLISLIVCNLCD